jgi:6-phosphogluconolactonase (cycloisomerase 2 family)
MSFLSAARPVLGASKLRPMLAAIAVLCLAGQLVSCSGNGRLPTTGTGNTAYLTLPNQGSVLMLHIDGTTGAVAVQNQTPGYQGTTPYGLALAPKKNFLYVANSQSNNISTFSIARDGTLSLVTTTSDGGSGPFEVLVDPSGQYLLVTNSGLPGSVSVFSIDSSSGALSAVSGSPFYANDGPSRIVMPPAGNLVYVTNPSSGMVTGFTFEASTGALTEVAGSPFFSGTGASALATDNSGQFLYVANTSAQNPGSGVIGNISGFSINANGGLTLITGSPFTPSIGTGPSTLVAVPNSSFLYATTPGSSFSIWCFQINSSNGQLTVANQSPFSQTAGGQFALIDTNGNYFFIGSEESDEIAAYTYDTNTGQPTAVLNSPFSINGQVPGKMVIVP